MVVYTVSFNHRTSSVSAPLTHVKAENLPAGDRARKAASQPSQPRPALLTGLPFKSRSSYINCVPQGVPGQGLTNSKHCIATGWGEGTSKTQGTPRSMCSAQHRGLPV